MDPIQKHFQNNPLKNASADCLDDSQLFAWTHESASQADVDRFRTHAAGCEACTEKAALLKRLADEPAADKEPPAALSKRVASRVGKKPAGALQSRLWFLAFAVFMLLSFTWKRYFAQMLVLAAVCAVKWLLETRARRVYVDITHRNDSAGGGSSPGGGRLADGLRQEDDAERG